MTAPNVQEARDRVQELEVQLAAARVVLAETEAARTTVEWDGDSYRLSDTGKDVERRVGALWYYQTSIDFIRTLASLPGVLPSSCAPRGYVVKGRDHALIYEPSVAAAARWAIRWNQQRLYSGPHIIYALHEVPYSACIERADR